VTNGDLLIPKMLPTITSAAKNKTAGNSGQSVSKDDVQMSTAVSLHPVLKTITTI
jgi:hypothetical protein